MPRDKYVLSGLTPVAFRLVALLTGLLCGLVLAELGARMIVGPNYILALNTVVASELSFFARRGQTNHDPLGIQYSFDTDGFRTTALTGPFDKTVLFIGDSFTQGVGVSDHETFAEATGHSLAKRGVSARCLNAGITGIGAAQELRLMRRLFQERSFDALVLASFPFNDLADNRADGGFEVQGDTLVARSPTLTSWIIRLCGALTTARSTASLVLPRIIVNALGRMRFFSPSPDDEGPYELERRLLLESIAEARKHHTAILIAIVGSDPKECHQVEESPVPDGERYLRVRKMIAKMDVPWLDLCTVTSGPESFGTLDRHYSPLGNAAVGEAIAANLMPLLTSERTATP